MTDQKPCPFPDPSGLDNDSLASLAVILSEFVEKDCRPAYEKLNNPASKWMLRWADLASQYVGALHSSRVASEMDDLAIAIDRGDVDGDLDDDDDE